MAWYDSASGEHLWYEERGEGQPVLLLHGWSMSTAVWQLQLEQLAASYRLIAPDLRGHGRSSSQFLTYDFPDFSSDLCALCEQRELSDVIVVGWSMGGQIAIHAAEKLSPYSAGMVLVATTPCFTASPEFPYGLGSGESHGMKVKVQRNLRRALDGFHSQLFAPGELASTNITEAIRTLLSEVSLPDQQAALQALEALISSDLRTKLKDITMPVLVMNGEYDRICLPLASQYLQEHISGAGQHIFAGCGHAPFLTRSTEFNTELSRFIRSIRE